MEETWTTLPTKKATYAEIMEDIKILPKKEYLAETIPRGNKFRKEFVVQQGDKLYDTWIHYEFKTDDSLYFGVTFESTGGQGKPVNIIDSYSDNFHQIPVFGRFNLEQPGKYTVCWDNSGNWTQRILSYSLQTGLPK